MNDYIAITLATAGIVFVLTAWFYEHQLSKYCDNLSAANTIIELQADAADVVFDQLQLARADNAQLAYDLNKLKDQRLSELMSTSLDEHLSALFDNELMLGNND